MADPPRPEETPDVPHDGGDVARQQRTAQDREREEMLHDQEERIRSGRARQGHIALDTPGRRRLFIGGLVAIVVLALLLAIFA